MEDKMKIFFDSIVQLFALIKKMSVEEWRGIRNTLLYLLITFYGLCFLQFIFDGHWSVKLIGFIFWLGGIFLLFKVSSLLRIAGLGEGLELFKITKQVPNNSEEGVEAPAIIENQLSVTVWNVTEKIFFLYSTCYLLVPLVSIRSNPWLVIYFTVAAMIVFLWIWRSKTNWVRPVAIFTSLVLLTINFFFAFPQLSYYTGIEKYTGKVVSNEAARTANEIQRLRSEQRARMVEKAFQDALEWQKANPGKNLPEELEKEIQLAKNGTTLAEYEKQLREITKKRADAIAKAQKKAQATKNSFTTNSVGVIAPSKWKKVGEFNIVEIEYPASLGGIFRGNFLPEGKTYTIRENGDDPISSIPPKGLFIRFSEGHGKWVDVSIVDTFTLDIAGLQAGAIGSKTKTGKFVLYEKET